MLQSSNSDYFAAAAKARDLFFRSPNSVEYFEAEAKVHELWKEFKKQDGRINAHWMG